MKRITILSLLVLACTIISCKSDKKKEITKESKVNVIPFSLKKAKNEINFIAYKTTDKVPVGGQFKQVNITVGGEGNSIQEAVNNTEFNIPVSSIFTKDSSRDFKIRSFFFGVMNNTKLLSGKLVLENDSIGYTNIKMNGITNKVPFNYVVEDNTFLMKATMNIEDWNAIEAINSLNIACNDLHKGTDGVSKTWSEVALNIKSTF